MNDTPHPLLALARGARAPHRAATLTLRAIAGAEGGRPSDASPSLTCRFDDDGRWHLTAVGFAAAALTASLRAEAHGASLDLAALPAPFALAARLHLVARPWHWDADNDWRAMLPTSTSPTQRLLVIAAAGWRAGRWHDGPVAHLLADGTVASYLPSGGAATLAIPWPSSTTPIGAALSATVERLEGSADERTQRLCLAAVDALLPQGLPLATLLLTRTTAIDALTLAWLRQTRPLLPIRLLVAGGKGKLTPPWRRFTENAGLTVHDVDDTPTTAALTALADALQVPAAQVPALVRQVNSISEMLPKSLVSS